MICATNSIEDKVYDFEDKRNKQKVKQLAYFIMINSNTFYYKMLGTK